MARHEFGIMYTNPVSGVRFDEYEPEKYGCITVDDIFIENNLQRFQHIATFCHTLDIPSQGLIYCGVTLIPPESMQAFADAVSGLDGLQELQMLFFKALVENKYIIHYGL